MEQAGLYGKATFAAGCFWDSEAVFRKVNGILETVAGYTGGSDPDPGNRLRAKTTGHTEAVALVFDPVVVSYDQLLGIFWSVHDPAQAGGQGDNTGSRYRSIIFYHITGQKTAAENSRNRLAASEKFRNRSILTEILPATTFWPAEDYQQQFYEKCGQGYTTSGRSGSDCSPILRTRIFVVLISFP